MRGWPADGYRGDYIAEVARAYLAGETVHADGQDVTGAKDADDLDAIRRFAVAALRREQDLDLRVRRVRPATESSLYTEGKVDETVQQLVAQATPTSRKARSGCARPSSVTTRTVMRKAQGATPTSCRTSRIRDEMAERLRSRDQRTGADHHSTVVSAPVCRRSTSSSRRAGPKYVLHQMVTVMGER